MSAQWKPGYHGPAYQGPQHSSEDFAKDQALKAWRASRGFFPSRGTSPLEGTSDATLDPVKDQAKRLGEASRLTGFLPASRGSFPTKQALSPRQSAHGLCALRRATGALMRGEDSVAVATLVYKAVNKAAPSGDGQGACLVPSNPGHGGMPQVDDVICSGLTADQGGAWVQYESMAGVSCPGQRGP